MLDLQAWFFALGALVALAVAGWAVSVVRRDVSIVDRLWSPFFPRAGWIRVLGAALALRLSVYITVRNHGQGEDRRYRAIRERNQPNFWLKSLYLVFLFQAVLAWVICLPALAAVSGQTAPGPLDFLGVTLWVAGFAFEAVGDWQLARFRSRRSSPDAVLDTGLWRYTRHPNYFGEALLWWGVYFLALSAGAWWTVFAPALMTFLLLKVSGVALLEKDIGERRPAYRDYVRRTNAFIPWMPRA